MASGRSKVWRGSSGCTGGWCGKRSPTRCRRRRKRRGSGEAEAGSGNEFIDEILEADRKAPRKQRHTAHRIWVRLRKEKPEIAVAECTVRQYVRKRKRELGLEGGEIVHAAELSLGPGSARWTGTRPGRSWEARRQKLMCFACGMASGGAFHGHIRTPANRLFWKRTSWHSSHFGGVFELLRFDNLKSAVKKILRGHQREENERFIAFRSHWGFQSEFCTPGRGNEKGGVEGEQGFFRRNHLVPLPEARDLEHLNELLRGSSREEEQRMIAGRTQIQSARPWPSSASTCDRWPKKDSIWRRSRFRTSTVAAASTY